MKKALSIVASLILVLTVAFGMNVMSASADASCDCSATLPECERTLHAEEILSVNLIDSPQSIDLYAKNISDINVELIYANTNNSEFALGFDIDYISLQPGEDYEINIKLIM